MARATDLMLEVATPLGLQLSTPVESVSVPGVVGEFTVLAQHRPLLSALKVGVLRYRTEGKITEVAVGSGFAEVDAKYVKILTDRFATAVDVDRAQIEQSREQSHQKFQDFKGATDTPEYQELNENVEWAEACLAISQKQLH